MNVFVEGPISPQEIASSVAHHSAKKNIGAHTIFLGQVRADKHEGKIVESIEYSAYDELALEVFKEIRERIFSKYDITCMHIYHSLGEVKAGDISLFVFVSSKHRGVAFEASREVVEDIKAKAPIWKKEIFEGEAELHNWV